MVTGKRVHGSDSSSTRAAAAVRRGHHDGELAAAAQIDGNSTQDTDSDSSEH